MKNRKPSFIHVIVVVVLSATMVKAQLHEPASLILPPPNWDAHKHVLALLVTTNKPGDHPLQPAWVGVEKVTTRTGWYATKDELARQTNQWFHFDRLTVCPGRILPVQREDRFICEASGSGQVSGSMFAYRPSLPTDTELLGMHDVASVANFIGFDPFKQKNRASAFGTCYFTLGPYNSIDTLNVMFMRRAGQKIDCILVRRGHFHQ